MVLEKLESDSDQGVALPAGLPLFNATLVPPAPKPSQIDLALARLDVDSLSPRQALDLLYELSDKAKNNTE